MNELNIRDARDDIPMEFAPDYVNKGMWDEICKSEPSDQVCLNWKEDDALNSLWEKNPTLLEDIPSDIFFAGTVPLLDCIITVDETDKYYKELGRYGDKVSCRVVIFENYKNCENAQGNYIVGALLMSLLNGQIIFPIVVCRGVDRVFTGAPGWHDIFLQDRNRMKKSTSQLHACEWMHEWLVTWYGVQIALLHPTIKEVFKNPKMELIYSNTHGSKSRRKTRYIRKHFINAGDIEEAEQGDHQGQYLRKTLIWYVIGHWRHYKDGRTVFVKPYWKGPLRELKQNIDEGREREIAIGEVTE